MTAAGSDDRERMASLRREIDAFARRPSGLPRLLSSGRRPRRAIMAMWHSSRSWSTVCLPVSGRQGTTTSALACTSASDAIPKDGQSEPSSGKVESSPMATIQRGFRRTTSPPER